MFHVEVEILSRLYEEDRMLLRKRRKKEKQRETKRNKEKAMLEIEQVGLMTIIYHCGAKAIL